MLFLHSIPLSLLSQSCLDLLYSPLINCLQSPGPAWLWSPIRTREISDHRSTTLPTGRQVKCPLGCLHSLSLWCLSNSRLQPSQDRKCRGQPRDQPSRDLHIPGWQQSEMRNAPLLPPFYFVICHWLFDIRDFRDYLHICRQTPCCLESPHHLTSLIC